MTDWKDVASKIAELAPAAGALAAPFIGPAGPLFGMAIKSLASVFEIKSADPQPDEFISAIQGDPQAALKLQLAKMDFEKTQLEEETKRLALQLADVQSARVREVEIIKAAGKDWDKRFLTILGAGAPLGILTWIVIDGFPKLSTEITLLVGNLIGILFAKYSTIFDYHMGTSSKK